MEKQKFILHSVNGLELHFQTRQQMKDALDLICWGAGVHHTDMLDVSGNVHSFVYDHIYERMGSYIVIDGGEIFVPIDLLPAIVADEYAEGRNDFKNWTFL